MSRLWTNDAYSTLASGLGVSDTAMVVATGHGDRFPVVVTPHTASVTLKNAVGQVEIVKITARASGSDSMTIVRAQEGTTAAVWLAGDIVSLRPTAAAFTAYEDHAGVSSGVHGVDGDVVGTSDTQTLTNKTLTQPTLTLKQGVGVNAVGDMQFDTTAKVVKVGDGAAVRSLADTASVQTLTNKTAGGGCVWNGDAVPVTHGGTGGSSQITALQGLGVLGNQVVAKSAAYTVVAADRGKVFSCTDTFVLSLSAAATLGDGFIFGIVNAGTGVVTVDCDVSEQIDGALTKDLQPGQTGYIVCNGTAFYTVGLSTVLEVPLPVAGLSGTCTGIDYTLSFTLSQVTVRNTSNNYKTLRDVTLSIDASAAGANGLDSAPTTPLAASTWYYVYVIWDGLAAAGIISASAIAPTLPSGYTYYQRVATLRTDDTANKYPLSMVWKGTTAQYKLASGSNVTAYPVMASGSTAWPTAVAVSNFVPATVASKIGVRINFVASLGNWNAVGPGAPASQTDAAHYFYNGNSFSVVHNQTAWWVLESANIYKGSNGVAHDVRCVGWEEQTA